MFLGVISMYSCRDTWLLKSIIKFDITEKTEWDSEELYIDNPFIRSLNWDESDVKLNVEECLCFM